MSLRLSLKVEGQEYALNSRDLTAVDAKDFRVATGVSLQAALQAVLLEGDVDLDRVAGFLWLVRRRSEPSLHFATVALALNYDTDIEVERVTTPEPGTEAGDPEA